MAYLPTGITDEQELAFREREIGLRERIDEERLKLERARLKATQRSAVWDAVQAIATISIPLLAFVGIRKLRDVMGRAGVRRDVP
jgi:hypothetical protein